MRATVTLKTLAARGFVIRDGNVFIKEKKKGKKTKKRRASRPCKGKFFIENTFAELGIKYVEEHCFYTGRKFRFDYAVINKKIAVEYEGVFGGKSRHTNVIGYSRDTTKYNLATIGGWKLLRYTASTYKNFKEELLHLYNNA